MFFEDASSIARLNEIIRLAAIGETVGVLANRMSPAERAEKLTPEGILHLTAEIASVSKSAELLRATVADHGDPQSVVRVASYSSKLIGFNVAALGVAEEFRVFPRGTTNSSAA